MHSTVNSQLNQKLEAEAAFRKKLRKGVSLFNRGHYFEAHELWEDLWRVMGPESKPVMQGIIQVAVGAHHWQNNNFYGARSMFRNALLKLTNPPIDFHSLDLPALVMDVQILSERLRSKSFALLTASHLPLKVREKKSEKGK